VGAAYLVVARFLKPHGLHGEAVVLPLTDNPEQTFAVGATLVPVTETGTPQGQPLVIVRSRAFHRKWLVGFDGVEDRTLVEGWEQMYLGAPQDTLEPPADDELYVYELNGAVVVERGEQIAVARGLLSAPGGDLLVVERDGREHLIPFRRPIVQRIDRAARTIEVELPPGLFEV
jgi:16S rRNA processing protein RimM